MRIDPYPEDRIARNVAEALAEKAVNGPVYLVLVGKQEWRTGKRQSRYLRYAPGGGPPVHVTPEEYHRSR